ncbi:MAG TPA: tonB-system energizer ExbB [Rhodopila sp.]|uniref:tonB-system energizer ExbB n=1 Tax=Rhodopila sp. TaxID=2480087 RepID=UPI002CD46EB0|nr:tonB-system energizer ExbB [Rhodopila sp.]HVY14546.1 tonB-system energizer ExbB [Rhodopila sp.]
MSTGWNDARRRVIAIIGSVGICLPGLAWAQDVAPTAASATVTSAAAPAVAPPSVTAAILPPELSVTSMFLHADRVVQAVMVGLVLASIVTWTVLLAKGCELVMASRRLRRAVEVAETQRSAAELKVRIGKGGDPTALMLAAVETEKAHSAGASREGIRDRIASRLLRIELRLARRMRRGTGVLATIGATAPFIGLFGTVWGIMNSFIGISKMQTTNLAVVAPGIAEALLATAAGLIAAIPAVVIYNLFARGLAGYKAGLGDLAAAVERLASRDLDLHHVPLRSAAE